MSRTIRALALAALLAAVAGCPTTQEVRAIVADSNAAIEAQAILADSDPQLENDEKQSAAAMKRAQDAVRRIDAFLAANPGMKGTANALIVRKALLLMLAKKPQMAKAAFAGYDASIPGSTRDLGLYKSFDVLVWWQDARKRDDVEWPSKRVALKKFDDVIAGLPGGEGITYYLLTLRANMQLKRASEQDTQDAQRAAMRSGLSAYSEGFDAPARANVRAFASTPAKLEGEPFDRLRWYAQAKVTYDAYVNVWENGELGALDWPADCKWLSELR